MTPHVSLLKCVFKYDSLKYADATEFTFRINKQEKKLNVKAQRADDMYDCATPPASSSGREAADLRDYGLNISIIASALADGRDDNDKEAEFFSGNLKLTCEFSCWARAGYYLSDLRAEFDRGQWTELWHRVSDIGLNNDLFYFYLGRAAEGLGKHNAAKRYYQQAIDNRTTCALAGILYNCRGIDVPVEARAGLARIANKN